MTYLFSVQLLKNTAELIDKLLDADEDICEKWSTADFVYACLEASKQIGFGDMETLDVVLHILQLVSTCETGIQSLCKESVVWPHL